MMIRSTDLIALFQRMYTEKWPYVWGSAKEGEVDCSGAFVYAYKTLGGGSIEHGSNSIYHKRVGEISTVPQPGYAAFRVRSWGEDQASNSWYGQKPGDVYHIGLVDADGQHILNAKGTKYGFCRDTLTGWQYFAPLKAVDYDTTTEDTDMSALYKAIIITESDPLRIRQVGQYGSTVIGHAPKGETVEVLSESSSWCRIRYGEIVGYAAAEYLQRIEDTEEAAEAETGSTTTTIVSADGLRVTLAGKWTIAND